MKTVGIVLAGGTSSRMGHDKAMLRWKGRTMLERQLLLLHTLGVEEAFIAGTRPGYPHLPDEQPYAGPLHALYGILQRYPAGVRILVIPVDMPLLKREHLLPLLENPAPLVAYQDNPLPLTFTTGNTLSALVGTRLSRNLKSLRGLWDDLSGATWLDTNGHFLANANTEQEWQELIEQYGEAA